MMEDWEALHTLIAESARTIIWPDGQVLYHALFHVPANHEVVSTHFTSTACKSGDGLELWMIDVAFKPKTHAQTPDTD